MHVQKFQSTQDHFKQNNKHSMFKMAKNKNKNKHKNYHTVFKPGIS